MEAYRKLGSTVGNLLLSLLLAGLMSMGLLVWMVIPCVGWLSGVGMLLYFSLVIMQLLVPVVVLEKLSPTAALRRAWELARRRFWWLLGLTCILYLLNLVVVGPVLLINYGVTLGMQGAGDFVTTQMIGTISQTLMSMLVGLLYYPLELSVMVLAYFDLRVRSEGFDLALQNLDRAEYPDPVESIAAAPAAPTQKSLVTGTEFGYFIATSMGGSLIIGIFYGFMMLVVLGVMSLAGGRGF
jgi:hypothetical protein